MLAVDESGEPVDGDQIMAICAVRMAEQGRLAGRSVVSTVMANLGFEVAMREQGITVVKTKVGDRYVLEQMQSMGANLGGEQSGHIIFLDHNTTGDGLVTALQLAAAVKESGIGALRAHPGDDALPAGARERARSRTRRGSPTSAAISSAVHAAEQELGDAGRVLVRASGTEPLVRVMAEAEEAERAQAVVDRLVALVEEELS